MHWTKTAKARLLPYPGDAWTVALDLKKATKAIAKLVGEVPEQPELDAEVERGIAGRLDHRYSEKGNHPRDSLPRDLVDVWVARRGVEFALEVLIAIARRLPAKRRSAEDRPYAIRWDGQPWGRLREHLLTAEPEVFAAAKAVAKAARNKPAGALRFALDYAFCDPEWIAEDLDDALDLGRGPLCVLASIAEPEAITAVLRRMLAPSYRKYELIEESVQHMPCMMSRLGDAGAPLVIEIARGAWDKPSRKPWLDLAACYESSPEAAAFLAEFAPAPNK